MCRWCTLSVASFVAPWNNAFFRVWWYPKRNLNMYICVHPLYSTVRLVWISWGYVVYLHIHKCWSTPSTAIRKGLSVHSTRESRTNIPTTTANGHMSRLHYTPHSTHMISVGKKTLFESPIPSNTNQFFIFFLTLYMCNLTFVFN